MSVEVQSTWRGYRLKQNGSVLSEILRKPGPTHSIFDMLAAATTVMAPGKEIGLLGFAGGGMIAPLRTAGCHELIRSVDLDPDGYELFEHLSKKWCGEIEFTKGDAVKWLRNQRCTFDVLIEDLSIPVSGDVEKPEVSLTVLPELIRKRLKPNGVVITNMLPSASLNWAKIESIHRGNQPRAYVLHFDEFENRIMIAGDLEQSAQWISRRLRACLEQMESLQANRFRVRTLK
ncbi:MAG: hypothetical protein ACPGVU_16705 [Limisphaerales bacterium]